ncbi:hypothetical protein LguiB_031015 [Lonicera macranthoides]
MEPPIPKHKPLTSPPSTTFFPTHHHPSTSTIFSAQTTPPNFPQNPSHQKQPLFEKPLTPSDVGKLNRLVIPKQYAEKYFPLRGGDSPENGLLLSFDDESGKSWRFRYSYWNSSQSYVLTKGWSRFVKEKRLDAGDVVLFERLRERLLIGWRRRAAGGGVPLVHDSEVRSGSSSSGGGGVWTRPYPSHPTTHHGPPIPYQPHHCLHAGSDVEKQMTPRGNYKTLRLFGVNLECHPDDQDHPATPDHDDSSHTHPSNHHNHMVTRSYNS